MNHDGSFSIETKVFKNSLDTMSNSCNKMLDSLENIYTHRKNLMDNWDGEGKESVIETLNNLLNHLTGERNKLVKCTDSLINIYEDIIKHDQALARKFEGKNNE